MGPSQMAAIVARSIAAFKMSLPGRTRIHALVPSQNLPQQFETGIHRTGGSVDPRNGETVSEVSAKFDRGTQCLRLAASYQSRHKFRTSRDNELNNTFKCAVGRLAIGSVIFHPAEIRSGPGCSDRFSAWISGSSAGVRPPSGWAACSVVRSRPRPASCRQETNAAGGHCRDRDSARSLRAPR